MKTCLLCHKEKSYKAFKKLQNICRECWEEFNKESMNLEGAIVECKNLRREYSMAKRRGEV